MKHTKAEVKAIVARSKHLRELLDYFGLALVGFDPGVSARNPNATDYFKRLSYNFDSQEWAWLEPLLVELRDLRKALKMPIHFSVDLHSIPIQEKKRK